MKKQVIISLIQTVTLLIIVTIIGNIFLNSRAENIPFQMADLSLEKTHINNISDNGLLVLVNDEYSVDMDYGDLVVPAFNEIALSRSDIEINKITLEWVDKLFNAATLAGYSEFYVTSGYRTNEKQRELYDTAEDKSYVQRAGHSEHETGLAVDISYNGMGIAQLGASSCGKWLAENAWKYGFILRYPEDKTDITKISYEPWHFRYVGIPHAYFCYENNLCYEEYIDYLKDAGGCYIFLDGISYIVYYGEPIYDTIEVPLDKEYEISRDNTGGYIITAREQVKY